MERFLDDALLWWRRRGRARGSRKRAWEWSPPTSPETDTRDLFMSHSAYGDEHALRQRRHRACSPTAATTADSAVWRAGSFTGLRHGRSSTTTTTAVVDLYIANGAVTTASRSSMRANESLTPCSRTNLLLFTRLGEGRFEQVRRGAEDAQRVDTVHIGSEPVGVAAGDHRQRRCDIDLLVVSNNGRLLARLLLNQVMGTSRNPWFGLRLLLRRLNGAEMHSVRE